MTAELQHKPMIKYTCINCGKTKELRESIYNSSYKSRGITRQFCDTKCKAEYQKKALLGKNNPSYRGKTKTSTCINCGTVFEYNAYGAFYSHSERKFCKDACRYEYDKKNRVEHVCETCGKIRLLKPSHAKRSRFCSTKCEGIWRSEYLKRENNGNWNGGSSFKKRFGEYCERFDEPFKRRCRVFFNNKCVVCGMTQEENGNSLPVHHVYYNKKMCCDGSRRMVVPLCNSHHSITNGKRDRNYWSQYFHELIALQYGGKCYYTREEYAAITFPTQSTTPLLSTPALQRSTEQSLS